MLKRSLASMAAAAVGSTALVAGTMAPASANHHVGTTSLAEVLAADGKKFDKTARDFDILDAAVTAVLEAKPKSPVKILANGNRRVTAFIPTDGAFRRLVEDLTGTKYKSEKRVFTTLANAAGIDTIEDVLLYHVVPGKPINFKTARQADGAKLDTALGATLKVDVRRHGSRVVLVDKDRDDKNARVLRPLSDINKGNRQIAHGISEVLRPINL